MPSGQHSGRGSKHNPQHLCFSPSILLGPSGLGLHFAPGKGAAGSAVGRSCQSARLLSSKFLCLHFKANCTSSAMLTFMSRMHVLANIVLIP